MRGTWHGSCGPNANDRTSVTLVMDFDGDNVTGQMNPGLRSVPLQKVTLDPNGWKVHLEADYKDRNGAVSHVVVDGKIEARPMMYLALTYDHRMVDCREAVQFLVKIKEFIEDPGHLLLES